VVQTYPQNGIQNGLDGIALVDDAGAVIEFISYEGNFIAQNGPAEGQRSEDIGVSENSSTIEGFSLQKVGTGCVGSDFTWRPAYSSKGRVNDGQRISCAPWINEFHYDNAGVDVDEFIEIGCNRQVNLTGYQIVLYNGNGGLQYTTTHIAGVCSPPNNFVVQTYPQNGIQNGLDGIALVDECGAVIEFISYEGNFIAQNGPADGQRSEDIGVSENSSTIEGFSLQKVGTGCEGNEFAWRPAYSSKGYVNDGQTISCDSYYI